MTYQPGDTLSDKYRLIETIGGGAMGEVFKAEHILMHKIVAIKFMHQTVGTSPEMIERFKREAQSAAAIDHANICAVTDFAVDENNDFYLVMEYLDGQTLQKYIQNNGPIPLKDAIFIMMQLLSCLQCVHEKGIVHRDIKSENIALIEKEGTNLFVKLLDFGIAHQNDDSALPKDDESENFKTKAGFLYGSPEYIAPEQANGDPIDHRVDLYSAGIVFYEMLTGNVPFRSESIIKLLHMQVCLDPPHLVPEQIEYAEQLDPIIQKCLAKDRDERYSSANEIIQDLEGISLTNASKNAPACETDDIGKTPVPSTPNAFSVNTGNIHLNTKVLIAIGAGVVILIAILAIIFSNTSNKEPETQSTTIVIEDMDEEDIPVSPFQYDEKFVLSEDAALRADPNILKALEALQTKDYTAAYASLLQADKKLHGHPNYLRLKMQIILKLSQNKETQSDTDTYQRLMLEILEDFDTLVKKVPDASRLEFIRETIRLPFADQKKFDSSLANEWLESHNSPELAVGLAWTIIYLPYDQNERRKKHMFTALELLDASKIQPWQMTVLDAWRLDKESCKDREKLIQQAFTETEDKMVLYTGILVPLYQQLSSEYCRRGILHESCNHCMQKWIKSGYETWTKAIKEETLADVSLPFVKKSDGEQ